MVAPMQRRLPLSPAQFSIWAAQQLAPEFPIKIGLYAELTGPLDLQLLLVAGERVAAEIESMNMRFVVEDGVPWQIPDHGVSATSCRCSCTPAGWCARSRRPPR